MTSKDSMYLWGLLSYVDYMNRQRSPVERLIDNQLGFKGISETSALEYMEWMYWKGEVPDYVQQVLEEVFWNSLSQ